MSDRESKLPFPILCLEENCAALVQPTDHEENLDSEAFNGLYMSAFDDHVQMNTSTLQFFLSPACSGIYQIRTGVQVSSCSSCSLSVCTDCRDCMTSHENMSCKDYALTVMPPNQVRLKIVDDILTLRCPRCKQAFLYFEGCFAISYSACPYRFCGWCLQDCGGDAHPQVLVCPQREPGASSYFGTSAQFKAAYNQRRRNPLNEFLQTLPPLDRASAQASVGHDLRT